MEYINKPPTIQDGDWIIKKIALTRPNISPAVIRKVISFQFDEANKAIKTYNSVELTYFGKFVYSTRRAELKLRMFHNTLAKNNKLLTDPDSSELIKRNALRKIKAVVEEIRILETKSIRNHERETDD